MTAAKTNKSYKKTVKDYECYRNFLRNIMIYGYRSRSDYAELGISGRSYDNYKRVLLDCMDNRFITERYEGKEKILGFNSDLYQSSRNFLIDTYFNKGLKKSTACCILLLLILTASGKNMTVNELADAVSSLPNIDPENALSVSGIKRCLDQLKDYGYINAETCGTKKLYSLSNNLLHELTEAELQKLYMAAAFYANISLLAVPGYYLMDTIENYLRSRNIPKFEQRDIWQYRCQNYSRIVDDEIIFQILEAMKNKQALTFKYGDKKNCKIIPQKIITDYPYGRAYLLAAGNAIYKIEKISDIKAESAANNIGQPQGQAFQQLALIFTFKKQDDAHSVIDIKKRLQEEASWMQREKLDAERCLYTAAVSDALSYAPWIRTFGKFVTPAAQCDKTLAERLYGDKKEALASYGII